MSPTFETKGFAKEEMVRQQYRLCFDVAEQKILGGKHVLILGPESGNIWWLKKYHCQWTLLRGEKLKWIFHNLGNLLRPPELIPASRERVVPTEWQVRTVLGDCISRAKVIPVQAPQYRQYAPISDFLDLDNWSLQRERSSIGHELNRGPTRRVETTEPYVGHQDGPEILLVLRLRRRSFCYHVGQVCSGRCSLASGCRRCFHRRSVEIHIFETFHKTRFANSKEGKKGSAAQQKHNPNRRRQLRRRHPHSRKEQSQQAQTGGTTSTHTPRSPAKPQHSPPLKRKEAPRKFCQTTTQTDSFSFRHFTFSLHLSFPTFTFLFLGFLAPPLSFLLYLQDPPRNQLLRKFSPCIAWYS